jgi:hypothetical protein
VPNGTLGLVIDEGQFGDRGPTWQLYGRATGRRHLLETNDVG